MEEKGFFGILKNVSEYFTFVQLMGSIGNVSHAIIVLGYWIFESNCEKSLCLTQDALDLICSPSVDEEQVAMF